MKVLLIFLLALGPVFALCPGTLNVSLDMHSETVKENGSTYRRADVLIFIPVQVNNKGEVKAFSGLRKKIDLLSEENNHILNVKLYNITLKTIDNTYLLQKLPKGSRFDENIKAKKVLSLNPRIEEPINLYPTDIRKGKLIIKLPPIRSGEELVLSYSITSQVTPPKPSVHGESQLAFEEKDPVYMLVGKYSIKFPYARYVTKDMNFENIKEVIEGLNRAGLKPIVKIFGIADGKTKDPEKNLEIAKKRATFVAQKVLGQNFACYIRRGFAGIQ